MSKRGVQGALQTCDNPNIADHSRAQESRASTISAPWRPGSDSRGRSRANQVNPPNIQVDLWAMTTLVNPQLKGLRPGRIAERKRGGQAKERLHRLEAHERRADAGST
jgi:hypothetical protein